MNGPYILRLPFRLPTGQVLSSLDQVIKDEEHGVTIALRDDGAQYIAHIESFDSEVSAVAYLSRSWAGRAWALLTYGVVTIVEEHMSDVAWASDPEQAARSLERSMGLRYKGPIDGIADGDNPIVYHNEKRLRFASVGKPTVTIGTPAAMYFGAFLEGMRIVTIPQEVAPPRLRTALDLYAAHFTEASANARFLTLVMCLEALAESRPKHPVAVRMLEQWQEQVRHQRSQYAKGSDEADALEALERDVIFRQEMSIRSRIRVLVLEALARDEASDATEIARQALTVYDHRSTLTHRGTLPPDILRTAEPKAKEIVVRVLRAKLRAVGAEG